MSYAVITLLLAVIFGLDGPSSALLPVLLAAFFIHLFG
jgi:hypothetical protein